MIFIFDVIQNYRLIYKILCANQIKIKIGPRREAMKKKVIYFIRIRTLKKRQQNAVHFFIEILKKIDECTQFSKFQLFFIFVYLISSILAKTETNDSNF